ncbi:uncharacterized protein SCHCODRAFT_01103724 [Schizophyllum commune H4-8]|nr:uncharacterized protein SCHCODRAFT_01103724 [Schizophyllum commune H4-8]KAI5887524.1 hypothetical protein SCHCODRAFT_01103724 [Schizophyllum commune H4-8]
MEAAEPTVELLREYKEQLMAAAAARDKLAGKTGGVPIRTTRGPWADTPQRSALGLAVGRLRDHETAEVSEKAKTLVIRWVAAAPARKRQESPSKSTQISQKANGFHRSRESTTFWLECDEEVFDEKDLVLETAFEHGKRSDIRNLARTDTGKKASASVSARSASIIDDAGAEAPKPSQDPQKPPRSTQPRTSSAHPTKLPAPPARTFGTDGLGDASALHEVPLRALTVELLYDALAAGAGDLPSRSLLPKAMSIEDALYIDTSPTSDDERTDASARTAHTDASARTAHTDAYVRYAHSAFIALSSASDFSTMRSDLLKGGLSAEDFVDYIMGEEDQVV